MNDHRADDSGCRTPNIELTAQQANLVRAVLAPQRTDVLSAPARDAVTGVKTVEALTPYELRDFRSTWRQTPVASIGMMNRAIASISEPQRSYRYLSAAFELELLMDRRESPPPSTEVLSGIPTYVMDGYTDIGAPSSKGRRRRDRILVDKERLRPQLLRTKREAIDVFSKSSRAGVELESLLRNIARSLREDVAYQEDRNAEAEDARTVLLSDCVRDQRMDGRHLALLYQLRMQEAGISSRIIKGKVRLFGIEAKHAWNIAWRDNVLAIVDVTYATETGPFVVTGASLAEATSKTMRHDRCYYPASDSLNRYQINSPRGPAGS